jgi:hypothetical protein
MALYALYQNSALFAIVFTAVALWSLLWKGLALWRSSQKKSKVWFVIILVFNTAGLIPILYLIFTKNPNRKKKDLDENKVLTKSKPVAEPKIKLEKKVGPEVIKVEASAAKLAKKSTKKTAKIKTKGKKKDKKQEN